MSEAALRDDAADEHVEDDMARYEAARAGQSVSHADVRAWLLSKDGDRPLPRPEPTG